MRTVDTSDLKVAAMWIVKVGLLMSFLGCALSRAEEGVASHASSAAQSLPEEVRELINSVKRLNEEPGLILSRKTIYQVLGARPTALRRFDANDREDFVEDLDLPAMVHTGNWHANLSFRGSREPEQPWVVSVRLSNSRSPVCYSSRQVEAYWGKAFVYQPMGVHAQLQELLRKQAGAPPTGPHDGESYNAEFFALAAGAANVSFLIGGKNSCLLAISISNIFYNREYSDEQIRRQ